MRLSEHGCNMKCDHGLQVKVNCSQLNDQVLCIVLLADLKNDTAVVAGWRSGIS